MLNNDKELKYAYELKEMYIIFNNSRDDMNKISNELNVLITAYKILGIPLFVEIGNTLSNWKTEIVNSFHTYKGRRINNGPIEGRNKYEKPLTEPAKTKSIKL